MTSTEPSSRSIRFRNAFRRPRFCCCRAAGTLPIATSERLRWIEWRNSSEKFHEEIPTDNDIGRQRTHAGRKLADLRRRPAAHGLGKKRNSPHKRQRQKAGTAVEGASR